MDSAESSHSRDDGSSNYSDVSREEGVGANDAADAVKDGSPFASFEFNDGRGDKVGEEDEEVAAANIAENVVIPGEGAEGAAAVRPHPQSLPAFFSGRVSNATAAAVLSSGSREATSRKLQPALLELSPTGAYVQTLYLKFSPSRVSQQVGSAYFLI